jgi:hypothetical protein
MPGLSGPSRPTLSEIQLPIKFTLGAIGPLTALYRRCHELTCQRILAMREGSLLVQAIRLWSLDQDWLGLERLLCKLCKNIILLRNCEASVSEGINETEEILE